MSVEVTVTTAPHENCKSFWYFWNISFGYNQRVSYVITTFSGPEPIKLPTTENKVKELTNKLLGTRELSQCIGTIHDTHIEIVELNEH